MHKLSNLGRIATALEIIAKVFVEEIKPLCDTAIKVLEYQYLPGMYWVRTALPSEKEVDKDKELL